MNGRKPGRWDRPQNLEVLKSQWGRSRDRERSGTGQARPERLAGAVLRTGPLSKGLQGIIDRFKRARTQPVGQTWGRRDQKEDKMGSRGTNKQETDMLHAI